MNPNHPVNDKFHPGQCYYVSGQVEQAIDSFEEAEWIIDELLGWNPALSVGHIEMVTPSRHVEDFRESGEYFLLAGMPE